MAAQVSLEAEVTALRRELQKQEQRAMVGRLEVRKARTELQALHKEHERASKTVEWLQTEKKALDARAETDKAMIKKLEFRLAAAGSMDAQDQVFSLRRECRELREEAAESKERAQALQTQLEAHRDEIKVLRRALEVKASDILGVPPSGSAGSEPHARMLYALAKSREDSITIAVSYAEAREDLVRARRLLDNANRQIGSLAEEREAAHARIVSLEAECSRHEERRARFESEIRGLEREGHTLQAKIVACERDKANLRQDIELWRRRVEEGRDGSERAAEAHQQEVSRIKEEAARVLSAEGDRWVQERARLEARMTSLSDKVAEVEARLRTADADRERERQSLESQLEAARRVQDESTEREAARRVREAELKEELDNLNSQVDGLTEQNQSLQQQLNAELSSGEGGRKTVVESAERIKALEDELSSYRLGRQAAESGLRHKLEATLTELHNTLSDRDALRQALVQARSDLESTVARLESANRELERVRESNDLLQRSKNLLQKALVGGASGAHRDAVLAAADGAASAAALGTHQGPGGYGYGYLPASSAGMDATGGAAFVQQAEAEALAESLAFEADMSEAGVAGARAARQARIEMAYATTSAPPGDAPGTSSWLDTALPPPPRAFAGVPPAVTKGSPPVARPGGLLAAAGLAPGGTTAPLALPPGGVPASPPRGAWASAGGTTAGYYAPQLGNTRDPSGRLAALVMSKSKDKDSAGDIFSALGLDSESDPLSALAMGGLDGYGGEPMEGAEEGDVYHY